MKHDFVETVIGALVIVIAGSFLYFGYTRSDITNKDPHPRKYRRNAPI